MYISFCVATNPQKSSKIVIQAFENTLRKFIVLFSNEMKLERLRTTSNKLYSK